MAAECRRKALPHDESTPKTAIDCTPRPRKTQEPGLFFCCPFSFRRELHLPETRRIGFFPFFSEIFIAIPLRRHYTFIHIRPREGDASADPPASGSPAQARGHFRPHPSSESSPLLDPVFHPLSVFVFRFGLSPTDRLIPDSQNGGCAHGYHLSGRRLLLGNPEVF